MECIRCSCEMKKVVLSSIPSPVYLSFKEKGIFSSEVQSSIDCYVCAKCGHIELNATSPEVFKDIKE